MNRRHAWALALVATFTMAISYVDRQVVAVLAPTITADLRIDETSYGLLASAFSLAYLVGAPIAGRIIDRVGARRGLLGAVLVWSAVAALHAVVPGFAVLFALRIALGFAEAPSFPGAAQTVHRALPPEDRARGFGVLFTGSSIGAMIAAPLATAIDARFGWRVAMIVTAIVGLIWVPLWLSFAWSRQGRAALDRHDPTPGSKPPPMREILRHRAVLRAMVVVFASAPTIAFVLLWGSKFLVRTYGLTQAQVGHYLWLPPLAFDAGAVIFGDLASRRRAEGPPRALFATATLLSLAVGLVPLARGPWSGLALAGVALAGGGGLFALLTSDMPARVPKDAVSLAGGITAAAQSLAYVVANPLIGRSVQATGQYTNALVALALWTVPGCLLWLWWRPPPRHPA
ncbi:MAG: MFS transporter [Deltaproteobacteria bacterium]|nr:MFS transporter [Deltaproteobacteria bacterium]